jgi:hypothetical protein
VGAGTVLFLRFPEKVILLITMGRAAMILWGKMRLHAKSAGRGGFDRIEC